MHGALACMPGSLTGTLLKPLSGFETPEHAHDSSAPFQCVLGGQ